MNNETFSLEDGKYEIERDTHGRMTGMKRNGEPWPEGLDAFQFAKVFHAALNEIANLRAPINMVLHCPKCSMQHIDAPEPSMQAADAAIYGGDWPDRWTNPPHRSHLCHFCGYIWRPADVPTNGVPAVTTKGKADSPINERVDTTRSKHQ